MVNLTDARRAPERQLFDEIGRIHAGLLGLRGSPDHLQPMAPHADPDTRRIYFFTKADTELARQVIGAGAGAEALFCVIGKDHDYHACISGRLSRTQDRAVIDKYWNRVAAAWFDGGKDDPQLTVLQFDPVDASIWASTDSSLRFGWEIAKANITESEPDLGVRVEVRF
jgi:general stress protein 26